MRAVRQWRTRRPVEVAGLRLDVIYGWRSGEWWIGARRSFPLDMIEINLFGLTLMVVRR